MPNLAANLTMMFGEMDFLERFAAAAKAGFQGVEYLFPYAYEADGLKRQLRDHGLVQVLHNLPAGNWAAGERGIACLPDRVDEFKAGVGKAIEYATALECDRVNCLAGIPPQATSPAAARETFIHNLQYAASQLNTAGVKLLIEPINTRDIPGFFLSGTGQAVEIIEAVGSDASTFRRLGPSTALDGPRGT
jgi:hydroxypyruvate isomerase